jgi:hypothetical protein
MGAGPSASPVSRGLTRNPWWIKTPPMKTLVRVLSAVAVFTLGAHCLQADGGYSFAITSESKKIDGEQTKSGPEIKTTEEWAYKVMLENKSFKDAANVEIKYIVFLKPDAVGEKVMINKVKLKRKQGTQSVPLIKNFEKYTFMTDSMTITGTQLEAGWYWANGANARAKDRLNGLWMRIFVDGQQVSEFINPPALKDKESWEGGGTKK